MDDKKNVKKILGAAVGGCVHVAGILSFLSTAEKIGFHTRFLGTSVNTEKLLKEISDFKPDIVGLSYRLSPERALKVFPEIKKKINTRRNKAARKKISVSM